MNNEIELTGLFFGEDIKIKLKNSMQCYAIIKKLRNYLDILDNFPRDACCKCKFFKNNQCEAWL